MHAGNAVDVDSVYLVVKMSITCKLFRFSREKNSGSTPRSRLQIVRKKVEVECSWWSARAELDLNTVTAGVKLHLTVIKAPSLCPHLR